MEKGLVQIYTGEGKGKTTAALGQAIRAVGQGLSVIIIQFIKGEEAGEILFQREYKNIKGFKIYRFNSQRKHVWQMNPSEEEKLRKETIDGFELAERTAAGNECDILILDEIFAAVGKGYILPEKLKNLIAHKSPSIELILTGRNADPEIIKVADLVTEMKNIKHPLENGIKARKGIER